MKNKFILYGLIFSVLTNIFQFVNTKNVTDTLLRDVTSSKKALKKANDSIMNIHADDVFNLDNNDEAQEYFYPKDFVEVKKKVHYDIMELNGVKGGNKLVPYEPINGSPFVIDKVKFLNHRWLIANYSDGKVWGEVLIKYFHNDDKPSEFETIETVLHTAK